MQEFVTLGLDDAIQLVAAHRARERAAQLGVGGTDPPEELPQHAKCLLERTHAIGRRKIMRQTRRKRGRASGRWLAGGARHRRGRGSAALRAAAEGTRSHFGLFLEHVDPNADSQGGLRLARGFLGGGGIV